MRLEMLASQIVVLGVEAIVNDLKGIKARDAITISTA